MDVKKDICWVCGKHDVVKQVNNDLTEIFYECPVCGRYQFSMENDTYHKINKNQLAAYLYYNAFKNKEGSFIEDIIRLNQKINAISMWKNMKMEIIQ